ncbi:MAG: hypothetical protein RIR10_195, partial [Planctomycetota bacterium]
LEKALDQALDQPLDPSLHAEPPAPSQNLPKRAPRQTSAPAIAATVALVLFSVFIGLYGPRLGNRQQLPGGTTLVELATAIEPRHAQGVITSVHSGASDIALLRRARGGDELAEDAREKLEATRQIAEEQVLRITGLPIVLPQPANAHVFWSEPERVRLPGAAGALVSCVALENARWATLEEHATILLLRDEDRYTVFDAYGRPRPMPEGEVFSVPTQSNGGDSTNEPNAIQFFRVGSVVVAVQASTPTLTEEIVRLLETSLAESSADVHTEPRRGIDSGGSVESGSATAPPSRGS